MRPYTNVWPEGGATFGAADADGLVESVTLSGGGVQSFVLDGTLISGGSYTADTPRVILFTSAGDDSGLTFTVTGTNVQGVPMVETVTGANATTAKTLGPFATVSGITSSGDTASTITIGTNDESFTRVIPIDHYADAVTYSVKLSSGASLTWDWLYTTDNIRASDFTEWGAKWYQDQGQLTTDLARASVAPVRACRIAITSYVSGTLTMDLLTSDV